MQDKMEERTNFGSILIGPFLLNQDMLYVSIQLSLYRQGHKKGYQWLPFTENIGSIYWFLYLRTGCNDYPDPNITITQEMPNKPINFVNGARDFLKKICLKTQI